MALNEITKGMSNAAEMINENFKGFGIVESGTNANGQYTKFADGLLITTSSASFGTGFIQTYNLPADFVGGFGSFLSSPNNDNWTLQDIAIMSTGMVGVNKVAVNLNQQVTRKTNYAFGLIITCIGRWK